VPFSELDFQIAFLRDFERVRHGFGNFGETALSFLPRCAEKIVPAR